MASLLPWQAFRAALLVNFWATWCPPCVKELPMLSEFAAQQVQRYSGRWPRGRQIRSRAAFLQRQPVQFPVAIAMQGGLGLSRSLGNLQGGLPFTVLFDAKGQVRQRKIGELSSEDLTDWSK
jgi:thiol-disulfide isomerase/thioredoxin